MRFSSASATARFFSVLRSLTWEAARSFFRLSICFVAFSSSVRAFEASRRNVSKVSFSAAAATPCGASMIITRKTAVSAADRGFGTVVFLLMPKCGTAAERYYTFYDHQRVIGSASSVTIGVTRSVAQAAHPPVLPPLRWARPPRHSTARRRRGLRLARCDSRRGRRLRRRGLRHRLRRGVGRAVLAVRRAFAGDHGGRGDPLRRGGRRLRLPGRRLSAQPGHDHPGRHQERRGDGDDADPPPPGRPLTRLVPGRPALGLPTMPTLHGNEAYRSLHHLA